MYWLASIVRVTSLLLSYGVHRHDKMAMADGRGNRFASTTEAEHQKKQLGLNAQKNSESKQRGNQVV